jgi:hypothetical protein
VTSKHRREPAVHISVSDIHNLLDYVAATPSISDGSLFLTLPTRALTGQQTMSSAGEGANSAFRCASSVGSSPSP